MGSYTSFEVTNKLALYSHDLKTVMIMEYPPRNIWGLPGGHLDPNEQPEQAMARELKEEMGIDFTDFQKVDFFVRAFNEGNEAVVLAYKAIAPEGFKTQPTDYVSEHDIWVTPEEVPGINMAESYKRFVLENWPH